MEWIGLNILQDNLIKYYLGNFTLFALFVIIIFVAILFMAGLSTRYVILFMLPLVGFFTLTYGYLNGGINNTMLVIILTGIGLWLGMELNNRLS